MIRRIGFVSLLAASLIGFGAQAEAATLDFLSLGSGNFGSNNVVFPEATITSAADSLYVGAGGIANSICAYDVAGNRCDNDLTIDFTAPVVNLTFEVGGWGDGDLIVLSILDPVNVLLGMVNITANGLVDLSGFGAISSLLFDDQSENFGVSYGNFSFDLAPVPLPAALPLFAATLGAAGVVGWRRKRRTVC